MWADKLSKSKQNQKKKKNIFYTKWNKHQQCHDHFWDDDWTRREKPKNRTAGTTETGEIQTPGVPTRGPNRLTGRCLGLQGLRQS